MLNIEGGILNVEVRHSKFKKVLPLATLSPLQTLRQTAGLTLLLLLSSTVNATASSLEQQLSVTWREQPLQVALERLTQVSQVKVWLDRRVDPQQRIELELHDASVQEILQQLAQRCDLGLSVVGPIVYLGPKQSARDLPALLQQARKSLAKAPRSIRKRWLQKEAKTIPRLTQPRAWLAQSLDKTGVSLLDEEKIPHDLWAKKELPPISLVDRVVLLLVGFDQTCQIRPDGKTCRIVVIAHPVSIEQKPRLPSSENVSREPLRRKPKRAAKKVFSLRLQNQPVGQVLDQLARQLQLEIIWDESIPRETPVSCEVHNVSLEELLQSILEPAGLQFQRQGKNIRIQQVESDVPR